MSSEDEVLKAKIAQMQKEIAEHESELKESKARMQAIFKKFDTNGDGVLDLKEFRLLSYECGIDVSQLSKEKIKASYDSLSAGKPIDFDAFFKWCFNNKTGKDKKASPTLMALRLKMASKSFAKAIQAGGKDLSTVKIPEGKDGGEARTIDLKFRVGEFKDAKASVSLSVKNDAKNAAAHRNTIDDFPEGVTTFAYFDIPLKENPDVMKVAKTAGAIETALGAIPWQQMGPASQFFKSLSVNMAEREDGRKVIRITFFCAVDPLNFAKQMAGLDLTQVPGDLASFDASVELPFNANDLNADDLKVNEDMMKVRISLRLAAKEALLAASENMLPGLPFVNDFMWIGLYAFKFFEGLNWDLAFRTPKEFVDSLPDNLPDNYRFRKFKNMKAQFPAMMAKAQSMPIKNFIGMGAGMATRMVPPPAKIYYKAVKNLTTGLCGARLHVQSNNTTATVDLKGLNFAQFMAELPAGPGAQ